MLSADVFVLASRRESFGLVLIEARETGCAIVATDVDGIAEALDGGRAGRLVPRRDVAALAAALRQLLSNPTEREHWQIRAKEGISGFRVCHMASEMKTVYDQLLSDRGAHSTLNAPGANPAVAPVKMRSPRPVDDRESQAARS